MHIKFCGLIFRVFDWQENSWGINFRGHGGVVDTFIVGFAKYASYCGLIFMNKRHTTKSTKIYTPRKFLHVRYASNYLQSTTTMPSKEWFPINKISTNCLTNYL